MYTCRINSVHMTPNLKIAVPHHSKAKNMQKPTLATIMLLALFFVMCFLTTVDAASTKRHKLNCPYGYALINGKCVDLDDLHPKQQLNDTKLGCPYGYVLINGQCVEIEVDCPYGYIKVGDKCVEELEPQTCPPGYMFVGDRCIKQGRKMTQIKDHAIKAIPDKDCEGPVSADCPCGYVFVRGKCMKFH